MKHIYTDVFDDAAFSEADNLVEIASKATRSNAIESVYRPLVEDVFQSLHQSMPVTINTEEATLSAVILDEVSSTSEFKALRANTVGNKVNAGVAARTICDSILSDLISMRGKLDHIVENINTDKTVADKLVDAIRSNSRDSSTSAMDNLSTIADTSEMLTDDSQSTKQKLLTAQNLLKSPSIRDIIKLAGRLKRIAGAKRAQSVKNIQQEYVGVTIDSNPAAAIPSELALLANPATRTLFMKKMVEGQLLQYDKDSKEKLGQGPIVLLLDSSGSMFGERDTWSKAVALAYINVARREKRDVCVIMFNDAFITYKFVSVGQSNNPLQMIKFPPNGCTNFVRPLEHAVDYISRYDNMKNADIVMITDGGAQLTDEFTNTFKSNKKSMRFHMYSILIGVDGPTSLDSISDKCYYVSDLINADKAIADVWGA